ncbi:LuxR family transcriptional regulator [Streptomyces sp. CB00455]|uniref:helix-turn-helix transcriptional regulator n=1 Tax=Streptomyces sp. CB00455 TaxID=1703927 RepID=UPI00093C7371|nr:helix-turn-helix transcriptional regulator [Streptomyces sp. CB00455]OKK11128.1 LuxR family transcriptional regulator [Streptomyces sp. CB00455]
MNNLSALGISALEERVYRHFLRNPHSTANDLLLRTPPADTERALRRLCELGMVRVDEECFGTVVATAPAVAIQRLIEQQVSDIHQKLQDVTQTSRLIPALEEEAAATDEEQPGVERLETLDHVRGRLDDLAFFTRYHIDSVEPYARLTQEDIDYARPLDLRCLRRGVQVRNVVLKEATRDPLTLIYLQELTQHGARIRVADSIVERILIFDRQTAIIPQDPSDTSRGALLTRETGLVDNIQRLFEKIWDSSLELSQVVAPDDNELSEMERQVLESMCTVGKDEIGARDLGVSVRTYRRHVADLLRTLGAVSRAHAALLARERHWI